MSGSTFDPVFYRNFYDLSAAEYADNAKVYEYYCSKGKALGHVANEVEMKNKLATLINFDSEMYSQVNLSFDNKPLGVTFPAANKDTMISHFMNHYFAPESGNLHCNARQRLCNVNELAVNNNEWANLMIAIDNAVKFDCDFYVSMYDVPVNLETRLGAFMHWVSCGIFLEYMPNASYFDVTKSMVNDVNSALNAAGVDMDYIEKMDGAQMIKFCSDNNIVMPAKLSSIAKNLFLFFNAGQKLRVFFSKAQCERVKAEHKKMYSDGVAVLKEQPQMYDMVVAKTLAEFNKCAAEIKRKTPIFANPAIKALTSDMLNTIKTIRKFAASDFIANFAKCNNLSLDALENVVEVLCKRLAVRVKDVTNVDMPVFREFVLNLVYNVFATNKKKQLTKEEYTNFIKNFACDMLVQLQTNLERSKLIADLEFLIENKKLIKLGKLAVTVMSMVV